MAAAAAAPAGAAVVTEAVAAAAVLAATVATAAAVAAGACRSARGCVVWAWCVMAAAMWPEGLLAVVVVVVPMSWGCASGAWAGASRGAASYQVSQTGSAGRQWAATGCWRSQAMQAASSRKPRLTAPPERLVTREEQGSHVEK